MYRTRLRSEEDAAAIALRGLTLRERLRLGPSRLKYSRIHDHDRTERLNVWRSWFERTNETAGWRNFLAENNLNEEKLLALDGLPNTNANLPWWATTLDRICRYLEHTSHEPDDRLSICENLAAVVAAFAWDEFSKCANSKLLARKAALTLKQSLLRRLAWTAEQAVAWEASVAASARRVSRDLELERDFQRYFFSSGVTTEVLRLLQNYPVLARLWAVQVEFWLRYVQDFIEHAALFARRTGMESANDEPIISSVDMDLSDPHEGNRSVLGVSFARGRKWFYKPRAGVQERAWFELLDWINVHGFDRPFRILKVNCQDRHCWMESVSARPCRNEKETRLFCFRSGALMCLIHLLRGVDFHPDNLVAAGPHPVVVDCETLLHAATSLPEYAGAEDASIFRTGMLMRTRRFSESVLGRREKIDRAVEELNAGFLAMHRLLRRRPSLRYLQRWADRLRMAPARTVYRPTAHYLAILKQSLAPSLLTSEPERSLHLHACCRARPTPSRRANAEVAALQNADIPVFRRKPRAIKLDLSEKTLRQSLAAIRAAWVSTEDLRVDD